MQEGNLFPDITKEYSHQTIDKENNQNSKTNKEATIRNVTQRTFGTIIDCNISPSQTNKSVLKEASKNSKLENSPLVAKIKSTAATSNSVLGRGRTSKLSFYSIQDPEKSRLLTLSLRYELFQLTVFRSRAPL